MVLSVEAADNNTILASGDMLGCYRIKSFLGRGGFGVTYLALDTKLDLQVAIKEYLPKQIAERTRDNSVQPISSKESPTFTWGLSNFIKEAQTLAKFKHPSIVRVMAVFEQNGTAYMVMEYERGQELKELIHTKEICNEIGLKRIIGPIIDGLAEVHRHGYIHRDIKPANILIRQDGSPVLLDFGSARLATGVQTKSLTALVTAGYAPLEQYSHGHDSQQGPWTDVYALAGVLYFAISGKIPVDSTLRGSAVVNELQDPLKSLEMLAPDGFSTAFCKAIDWALSFRIKDRPQTLLEWRAQLLEEAVPPDSETVAMPSVSTRLLDQNLLAAGHQTARNEIIKSHRSSRQQTKYTPPSADSAPNSAQAADGARIKAVAEPNKREIQQRNALQDKISSTTLAPTERLTTDKRSKKALFIELSFIGLTVLAVLLKNHWLPAVQGFFTNDKNAEPTSVTRTSTQPLIDTDLNVTEGGEQAASELEQQTRLKDEAEAAAREAKEKRRQDEQHAARLKQLDALRAAEQEAVRRAEAEAAQNERIEKQRALAEAKLKEQLAEAAKAAEADRLAEEKAKRDEEEAARIAEQKAKSEKEEARLAEEKAKRAKEEAAKKAKAAAQLEAKRVADEQAIKLAEEAERLAFVEATQQSLDSATPIADTDIGIVFLKFKSLRDAIVNKDESALVALTYPSQRKKSYFNYLFATFETIEVSLDDVRASPGDQTVRANLRLIRFNRRNGDVVFPPVEFETIPIYSVRSGEWSRIHW